MAQLRTDVAMIHQIQHLYFVQKLSKRAIARSLGMNPKTVRKILKDKIDAQADPSPMEPQEAAPLPSPSKPERPANHWSLAMDWEKIHSEYLQGASIKILHKERAPPGVSYWVFNREYHIQKPPSNQVTMRLIHNPAEKMYFDFADGVQIIDPKTGVIKKTQLLVAVLPFSSYTWAEFLPHQKQPLLMEAMERAFHFFGGITPYVTVDNMKTAVTKAHLYDPVVNATFVDFANHWNFAVIPTRPYKPRDKAAVESNIGVIQRSFFQEVRHRTFYSLAELNSALKQYLGRLNSATMKEFGLSRIQRFEKESGLLKPLASQPFEICEWRQAKVHPDCHIQVAKNCYSVPYTYVGRIVRVKITSRLVEIFDPENQNLLATHSKCEGTFKTSTNDDHYPQAKVATTRFEVKSAKTEADAIGPGTRLLVDYLLDSVHPLKYLRRVQGILRLVHKKTVSIEGIEYAAKMALSFKKANLHFIQATALHFDQNGKRVQFAAPPRDPLEVYLHQPNPNPSPTTLNKGAL